MIYRLVGMDIAGATAPVAPDRVGAGEGGTGAGVGVGTVVPLPAVWS